MRRFDLRCSKPVSGARLTIWAVIATMLASPAAAQKTDVVVLDDGNRFVGEIKRLDRGLLVLSLNGFNGDASVKWDHVIRLTSDKHMEIQLRAGERVFGTLIESSGEGALRIQTTTGSFETAVADVVIIDPIKDRFWRRLKTNVSTGFSYTKATDVLQFNFGGTVEYRKRRAAAALKMNSIINSKAQEKKKTNSDIQLYGFRFFSNMWFYRGGLTGSRNDELGIDFRGSVSAGLGRAIMYSNRRLFYVSTLLSGNREFTSDGGRTNNLELVLASGYDAYRYDTPKVDVEANLLVYLNLTSWGRYRISHDGLISLELVKDLFWDITHLYYRYDSDPSTTASSKSDYGIVTGVRYKFN